MNKKQFILLMSVPALIIILFMSIKLLTLNLGQEILLKTAPVDPRDLFRGDYVTLSYDISTIDLDNTPHDTPFPQGNNIYATLSKKEKYWTIDRLSHIKPSLTEKQVCMKGKVTNAHKNRIFIEWGIESYFVPEGKGRVIENQRNTQNISVIISVDSTCSSVLKKIMINDEPVKFE